MLMREGFDLSVSDFDLSVSDFDSEIKKCRNIGTLKMNCVS